MEEEIVYIYALIDPITNNIKYIGQTNNPRNRKYMHIKKALSNSIKDKWVRKLLSNNYIPIFKILDKTNKDKANNLEDFYIEKFNKNGNILNKVYNRDLKHNIIKQNNNKQKRKELEKYTKRIKNLTCRETQITELICDGLEYEDICKSLYITRETLKQHMQNIRYKFNLNGYNNKTWVIKLLLYLINEKIGHVEDLTFHF